jgi:hypothetical protein
VVLICTGVKLGSVQMAPHLYRAISSTSTNVRMTHLYRSEPPTGTTPCLLGLSATSHQYFSLRTNQLPATSTNSSFLSEQISTSHQPPAKRTCCKCEAFVLSGLDHAPTSLCQRTFVLVGGSNRYKCHHLYRWIKYLVQMKNQAWDICVIL